MSVPKTTKSEEESERENVNIVMNPLGVYSLLKELKNKRKQQSGEGNDGQGTSAEEQNLYPQSIPAKEFHLTYRVTKSQFHEIHDFIKNDLNMKNAAVPETITTEERLLIALKFLATGESLTSLGSSHQIGFDAVKEILQDVFGAIWAKMGPVYMPKPTTKTWEESEHCFKVGLDFPNCCGALYAKRVNLNCPINDDTANASKDDEENPIILLAIVNPKGKFIFVDIGPYAEDSDGGVLDKSVLGKLLEDGEMQLPAPKPLSSTSEPNPHVIVAEEAFPLKPYLMRSYSDDDARDSEPNNIFNYRLSRARCTAENAFAIAKARWHIFDGPLQVLPEMVEKIFLGIFCLNNYLGLDNMPSDCYSKASGPMTKSATFTDLKSINEISTEEALEVRSKYNRYFCEEGALPWQLNLVRMAQQGDVFEVCVY